MGKKKRFIVGVKPFCYYCDKEFNNDNILHYHQRARHFSCYKCKDRFSSALAVKTHILQIHKEDLKTVPNSITGRENFDLQIFGMDGVPLVVIENKLREKIKNKRKKLAKDGFIDLDPEEINEKGGNKKKFKKEFNTRNKNIMNSTSIPTNSLNMQIGVNFSNNLLPNNNLISNHNSNLHLGDVNVINMNMNMNKNPLIPKYYGD